MPGGLVATVGTPTTVRSKSLLLAARGRAVQLGEDVRVVPAWRGGDLLVSSYGPGGTSVLVTERTGQVRSYWARAGLVTPVRDTAAGLLVAQSATAGSTGADLALVEPGTGKLRRPLARGRIVVAAGPTAVAHVAATCGRDCPVTVTDLADGRSRDYRTPDEGAPIWWEDRARVVLWSADRAADSAQVLQVEPPAATSPPR